MKNVSKPLRIHDNLAGQKVLSLSAGLVSWQITCRVLVYCLTLSLLIIAMSFWAMLQGDYHLSPLQVLQAFYGEGNRLGIYFVTEVRAPRIIAALIVGAALGISGAIFQGISGNSLGSPDIIGFTNGAATGALITIILGNATPLEIAVGAVLGGFGTSLAVWFLTRHTGLRGFRLVLIGLGLGATLSAVNSLLVVRASLTQAQTAASWLAGSLNTMNWNKIIFLAVFFTVLVPFLLLLARPLDILNYGDNVASGLGVNVSTIRVLALFVGVILVSLATSVTGPLAFVALSAPHIAQKIAKKRTLFAAGLTGSTLVLGSDLIGQYAFNMTLQVGIVTGALGGLYLIYLIATERKK
ncbi:FecCD family ABC transporter permease [Rothia sp. CCM 9419]|uniref:FecCD family ABC transporter permease n=1 Tax=Rothia sp. CCM 9419 TaxID=3402662 RepID=UPI003AEEB637